MPSSILEKSIRRLRNLRADREPFGGRRIIMIHPPKCGGTSVAQSIKFRAWYSTFDLNNGASILSHQKLQENSPYFRDISLDDYRRSIIFYYTEVRKRFIYGHFTYDEAVFAPLRSDYDFVTVLRNPVHRFISQYYFTKQKMPLEEFIQSEKARDWATDYRKRFSNDDTAGNPVDARRSAIDNLKSFRVVGKLENLQSLQSDFKSAFGLSIKVPNFNRGNYSKIDDKTVSKILELCNDDIEIYNSF